MLYLAEDQFLSVFVAPDYFFQVATACAGAWGEMVKFNVSTFLSHWYINTDNQAGHETTVNYCLLHKNGQIAQI